MLIANWPFTLLRMMPTNHQLMAADPETILDLKFAASW